MAEHRRARKDSGCGGGDVDDERAPQHTAHDKRESMGRRDEGDLELRCRLTCLGTRSTRSTSKQRALPGTGRARI